MDTGCGFALVSASAIAKLRRYIVMAKEAKAFSTANGLTTADATIVMRIPALADELNSPTVLQYSPAVLSVGYRCHRKGYGFYWRAWKRNPVLALPDRRRMVCPTEGHVSYIFCQGDEESDIFAVPVTATTLRKGGLSARGSRFTEGM